MKKILLIIMIVWIFTPAVTYAWGWYEVPMGTSYQNPVFEGVNDKQETITQYCKFCDYISDLL